LLKAWETICQGLIARIGIYACCGLNRQCGRSHNPGGLRNLCLDDGHLPAQQVSGSAINFPLNRIQQKIAGPSDLPAKDNDLGIERVNQTCNSATQNQRGALNNDLGNFIALSGTLKDVAATRRRAQSLKLRLDPTMDGCKRFSLYGSC
jgi:hypothetical protein